MHWENVSSSSSSESLQGSYFSSPSGTIQSEVSKDVFFGKGSSHSMKLQSAEWTNR